MTETVGKPEAQHTPGVIVARPSKSIWDWRGRRYIIIAGTLLLAGWFAYDGYVGWPEENRQYMELTKQIEEAERQGDLDAAAQLKVERKRFTFHEDFQILLQKALAFGLPPLALLFLIYVRYNSRGEYRLDGDTLHAPGHPPVPLEAIRRLDKTQWDRKGIAYVDYELADGRSGRIALDDFIYERKPTDAVFERIDLFVKQKLATAGPKKEQGAEA